MWKISVSVAYLIWGGWAYREGGHPSMCVGMGMCRGIVDHADRFSTTWKWAQKNPGPWMVRGRIGTVVRESTARLAGRQPRPQA